jgi:putative integral membrane protein (TIGR02587 family)
MRSVCHVGSETAILRHRELWRSEVVDMVRAASGGLLFGVPLLYTVEVMWTGQHTGPGQALAVLAVSFILLTILNRTAGFRGTEDTTLRHAAADAVEGVALAIVLVLAMLALLGEIDSSTPLAVSLGKIVYEVLPVCVGIGVAHSILREGPADDGSENEAGDSGGERKASTGSTPLNASIADLGASLIGAVFIALSIAPTDEVPMLTASRSPVWLLMIVAASLLIAYSIVFVAGFAGQSRRHAQRGLLQHPLIETLASYVVALFSSFVMLWLFQRADAPGRVTLSQVIVLGLPAAIGGAAGRLAI